MEKNFKRLSLALLALGLSAPAFADNCVMVPSQKGGFKVGIDALYLRPTNSNLGFATFLTVAGTPVVNPTISQSDPTVFERERSIDPRYDWGFYAQIGYLFPCTGNDLTVGYTYLNSDHHRRLVATGTDFIVLPPLVEDYQFAAVDGKIKTTLNVVDLEAGQRFTTGAYDMRMFAGVRYANIDSKFRFVGFPPIGEGGTPVGIEESQFHKAEFSGAGPRIGVDARYCLSSGFGIDANVSTSLLAGNVRHHARGILIAQPSGEEVISLEHRGDSHNRLVPVLEAKLGIDYTHIIDCRCKSALVFEAGYQATNYFNVRDRQGFVFNNVDGARNGNGTTDFGYDGPYFGVKYYA